MKYLLFLYGTLFFFSCGTAGKLETMTMDTNTKKNSELLFLVLRISRDSLQSKNKIEVISKSKVSGQMKKDYQTEEPSESYLTFDLYKKDEITYSVVFSHPLYKTVEYEEGNTLTRKVIELNSEEFFVRLPINAETSKIKISETIKKTNKTEIAVLNL